MDEPITDVIVVTSAKDCPHGYTIIKDTPCGHAANLWEKVFGGRSGERYICFTKNRGQNNTVIEDMIIPPPSQTYLRKGYRAITDTPDGEEPLRHKQLVLKRTKRNECSEAVVDIVVYRSKDDPAQSFRKLAKVNDLYVCVRTAKITPASSNTTTDPSNTTTDSSNTTTDPSNTTTASSNTTTSEAVPVQNTTNIAPVEEKVSVQENVQVHLDTVVESTPNVDAVLDRMDQALTINQEGFNRSTEYQAAPSSHPKQDSYPQYPATAADTTTTYPQTVATHPIPEPQSTYSSSQTTQSSYPMPDSNNYASSSGTTTYPASTYSSSSYSNPGTSYSDTSNPYSSTSYPGSSQGYPSAGTQYSNTGYPTPTVNQSTNLYPGTSSGQYSSNPYSNASYSSASYSSASYSTSSNPYGNAGYSDASYSGSAGSNLPYLMNPNAGTYQQYPSTAGYSAQPPANTYPNQYQGSYTPAPPTNQGYGGYLPPTGGSYGSNQSAYPPTTHFSGDIGF